MHNIFLHNIFFDKQRQAPYISRHKNNALSKNEAAIANVYFTAFQNRFHITKYENCCGYI
jgi:hypothetical protein